MRLKKHYSMEASDRVLRQLKKLDVSIVLKHVEVVVSAFSNGREQGYHLLLYRDNIRNSNAVSFAQQRTSDDIVVYYGNENDFDITTNHPVDWDKKKFFRYNELDKCVAFIADQLTKEFVDG